MAIWQYTFIILPKEGLRSLAKNIEEFDDSVLWRENLTSINVFQPLADILPVTKSWSDEIFQLGNLESNCVEVLFKNSKVVSASCRIDFTSEYEVVLRGIIEFCLMTGFLLIDETMDSLNMNFETLNARIINSSNFGVYKRLSE